MKIEGIDCQTITDYMHYLNVADFEALVELFMPEGVLQPPLQQAIVGKEAILKFFRQESYNLKVTPAYGVIEPTEDGSTHIKVTGKVQTFLLGRGVEVNVAWRFQLSSTNEISFVAIDLLASPQELLNLIQ